jgi:hypothetical protein
VIVHISFHIRDERQTGQLLVIVTFHLIAKMEGKQAIRRQHIAIALISFDFREGRQNGSQE